MKRSPLILASGQQQQLQSADYADIGIPYMMHKNRLINGDFDVWQRGTAALNITASATYYPDRWACYFNGTGVTVTASQQTHTPGQTDVPDNPKYFARFAVSTAPTSQTSNAVAQRIEGVQQFAGQQCTLSFYAKAATTGQTLTSTIKQVFGTGGTPSTEVDTAGGTFSLTTSFQKFSYTFTVPSISGKTLGTNGDDFFELNLGFPTDSIYTIDISHIQLEAGPNATQFEHRYYSHELSLCQRYYVGPVGAGNPGCFFSATAVALLVVAPTPMRGVPTLTLTTSAPIVIQPGVNSYTASGATIAWSSSSSELTGSGNTGIMNITGFSGGTGGQFVQLDGNYVILDAEL